MSEAIEDMPASAEAGSPVVEPLRPSPELAAVMRRADIGEDWFRPGVNLKYVGESQTAPVAMACFAVDTFAQDVVLHVVWRAAETRHSVRLTLGALDGRICGVSAIPALGHWERLADVLGRVCEGFRWARANLPAVQ